MRKCKGCGKENFVTKSRRTTICDECFNKIELEKEANKFCKRCGKEKPYRRGISSGICDECKIEINRIKFNGMARMYKKETEAGRNYIASLARNDIYEITNIFDYKNITGWYTKNASKTIKKELVLDHALGRTNIIRVMFNLKIKGKLKTKSTYKKTLNALSFQIYTTKNENEINLKNIQRQKIPTAEEYLNAIGGSLYDRDGNEIPKNQVVKRFNIEHIFK